MADVEDIRGALKRALVRQSPEELAAEVGGVAPNTIRNFARGERDARKSSLRAFEQWYAKHHAPRGVPQPSGQTEGERQAYYAGVAMGLTKSIRLHLSGALADSDELLAHLQALTVPEQTTTRPDGPAHAAASADAVARAKAGAPVSQDAPRRRRKPA